MLDTLKYAKRLQEAGFTAQHAEAQASALWEAIEDTVATKQDLRELETRIDGRFKEVDGRFRLLYWTVGFNLAFSAAMLLKLLAG